MIKRAVRFATLMCALSVPMWVGLQEPLASAQQPGGVGSLAPGLSNTESVQATATSAMASQSVWHVMALSSR